MNRMSTEMSGANHLMFPAAAGIASVFKRRAAATAQQIGRRSDCGEHFEKAAVFPIGNDFGVRSGREVPLPPRSLSLFDYDDLGSARLGPAS